MIVELLKNVFKGQSWIDGKEQLWALFLSTGLGFLSWKYMGSFAGMGAVAVLINSFMSGVIAGVTHDKVQQLISPPADKV
jgi:hypothetical protein